MTEETRAEICKILAWDFKQLEVGVHDFINHTGSFHPLKSAREKLAGEPMPVKAVTCLLLLNMSLMILKLLPGKN